MSSAEFGHPSPTETTLNQAPPLPKKGKFLTNREKEVLQVVAQGLTAKGIGQDLEISSFTAKNHLRPILRKLHARSRIQAILEAVSLGLIDPSQYVEKRNLDNYESLTKKEREVLEYFADPRNPPTAEAAAQSLGNTLSTIKNHLCHIHDKLGVEARIQAVMIHLVATKKTPAP